MYVGSRSIILHIYSAKTKVLISFMVTTQLICPFVFTYAKDRIFHGTAHIVKEIKPGMVAWSGACPVHKQAAQRLTLCPAHSFVETYLPFLFSCNILILHDNMLTCIDISQYEFL